LIDAVLDMGLLCLLMLLALFGARGDENISEKKQMTRAATLQWMIFL
jgi:hypothetical protein